MKSARVLMLLTLTIASQAILSAAVGDNLLINQTKALLDAQININVSDPFIQAEEAVMKKKAEEVQDDPEALQHLQDEALTMDEGMTETLEDSSEEKLKADIAAQAKLDVATHQGSNFTVGLWYNLTDARTLDPVLAYIFDAWTDDCETNPESDMLRITSGQYQVLDSIHYKLLVEARCTTKASKSKQVPVFHDNFLVHVKFLTPGDDGNFVFSCMKGRKNWLGRNHAHEAACISPLQRHRFDLDEVFAFTFINGTTARVRAHKHKKGLLGGVQANVQGMMGSDNVSRIGALFFAAVLTCLTIVLSLHFLVLYSTQSGRPSHQEVKGLMTNDSEAGMDSEEEEEEIDLVIPSKE